MTYLPKLKLSVDVYIVATALLPLSIHNKLQFLKLEYIDLLVLVCLRRTRFILNTHRGVFIPIDENLALNDIRIRKYWLFK